MRSISTARASLSMGALIFCCCLVAGLPVRALQGKRTAAPTHTLRPQIGKDATPEQVDADSFRSEMRGLIERHAIDRASLNRYFAVQGPERSEARGRRGQRLTENP
jgi:hypothetical protein